MINVDNSPSPVMKGKKRGGARYKKSSGRMVTAIVCLIIAALLAGVALPMLYSSQNTLEEVLVAKGDILKGEKITASNAEMIKVGTYGLPTDVLRSFEDNKGKVAQINIQKGDYLTERKVGDTSDSSKVAEITADGKSLVSISVKNTAQALAGHLQPGDTVDVYTQQIDEFGEETYVLDPSLGGLQVYDVENSDTRSIEAANKEDDSSTSKDTIAATVTFVVTPAQAQKLIKAEDNDGIHMVLTKRALTETAGEKKTEIKPENAVETPVETATVDSTEETE